LQLSIYEHGLRMIAIAIIYENGLRLIAIAIKYLRILRILAVMKHFHVQKSENGWWKGLYHNTSPLN
jgi:hypothetical protein